MLGIDVSLRGPRTTEHDLVLTPGALSFVGSLAQTFRKRFDGILANRSSRRDGWRSGDRLGFLAETAAVRAGDWQVGPIPADLERRNVELSGPIDRKTLVQGLASGADVFLADFEDTISPTWQNIVEGHVTLRDVVHGERNPDAATLVVRPRGLHLLERNALYRGEPIPGALFDFGLHMFHNARHLIESGSGPYFYLPKIESRHEARLWNDIFMHAQHHLGLPRGTIKASVLIETLPAAFEMDEILHELREHVVAMNCGRWDYIFSFVKVNRWNPEAILPDRARMTPDQPFMRAFTQLLIRTCHRRGALAIGGTTPQGPITGDSAAQRVALATLRSDKEREAKDGYDGSSVAHPALIPAVRKIFKSQLNGNPNQLHVRREDVVVSANDLLAIPTGPRTESGLRENVRIGLQYLESWLSGDGHVALNHRIEDASTAEVARVQIWQLYRHSAKFDDGRVVTREFIAEVIDEETNSIKDKVGATTFRRGRYRDAKTLFTKLCLSSELEEFLTTFAYDRL